MSQQSKYGAVEVAEAPAAATPKRRGVVIALCLVGGALFAVAGPAKSPRLRGALQLDQYWTQMGGVLSQVETDPTTGLEHVIATMVNGERVPVYGEAPKDECGCTTGCPPIVKASATTTPIINTAGGVASQSSSNAGGSTVYTGPSGAASRGNTGAGDAKYIPGRK